MLLEVAIHILHSTTPAAAAGQNQTHAIRNVLQIQSSGLLRVQVKVGEMGQDLEVQTET